MIPIRNCYLLFKRTFFSVIFLITAAIVFFSARYIFFKEPIQSAPPVRSNPIINQPLKNVSSDKLSIESAVSINSSANTYPVNPKVHIFYYPWYGNPEYNSEYFHWNHRYLPNWDQNDKAIHPTGRHQPPEDVGANFYPQLGCYSSKSPAVVSQHMEWIQAAGIGVLAVSWYPPDEADREGEPFDKLFPLLLDTAMNYSVKIAFHIEPYKGRNPENMRKNLEYIINKYGNHPSTYKLSKSVASKPLPVFYIYDSYLNSPNSWSTLLRRNGKHTVRNTELDGIFLGLVVELRHKQDVLSGGFDGFYTYFAANDFTFGSSWKNWKSLSNFARKNGLLFVPSVGPGYVDTRVRPWNSKNIRLRRNGKYFRIGWNTALQTRPALISITSFNEWHEGTQIEPAIPFSYSGYTYEDYQPEDPDFYLKLTSELVAQFTITSSDNIAPLPIDE